MREEQEDQAAEVAGRDVRDERIEHLERELEAVRNRQRLEAEAKRQAEADRVPVRPEGWSRPAVELEMRRAEAPVSKLKEELLAGVREAHGKVESLLAGAADRPDAGRRIDESMPDIVDRLHAQVAPLTALEAKLDEIDRELPGLVSGTKVLTFNGKPTEGGDAPEPGAVGGVGFEARVRSADDQAVVEEARRALLRASGAERARLASTFAESGDQRLLAVLTSTPAQLGIKPEWRSLAVQLGSRTLFPRLVQGLERARLDLAGVRAGLRSYVQLLARAGEANGASRALVTALGQQAKLYGGTA